MCEIDSGILSDVGGSYPIIGMGRCRCRILLVGILTFFVILNILQYYMDMIFVRGYFDVIKI